MRYSGEHIDDAVFLLKELVKIPSYTFQEEAIADFLEKNAAAFAAGSRLWMATTKAHRIYTQASFGPDDYLMFGKESAGIPEEILVEYEKSCIRIPMLEEIRSLNLSNSAAIVLYEALRQNGFAGLQEEGQLHRLTWKE